MEHIFRKIRTSTNGEYLLVFEQGEIQKPIMTLEGRDVEQINKEWKKKIK